MTHFAIAHVLRLRDGLYAVRSAEFPGCEGRDLELWPAREQFRQALSEHVGADDPGRRDAVPCSLRWRRRKQAWARIAGSQIEAEDRMPKTYDYAVIVEVDLAPDDAERLAALRIGKLLPQAQM